LYSLKAGDLNVYKVNLLM